MKIHFYLQVLYIRIIHSFNLLLLHKCYPANCVLPIISICDNIKIFVHDAFLLFTIQKRDQILFSILSLASKDYENKMFY